MPDSENFRNLDVWDAPTNPITPGRNVPPPMPPLPYGGPAPTAPLSPPPDAPPPYRPISVPPPEGPGPARRPRYPAPRRWTGRRILKYAVLTLLALLLIFGGLALHRLYDFGSAISTQAPLSTQTGYMSGGQRVNVVVLGYGGSGHDGAYLTDSLMVISLVPSSGATTLVSVPRDLWVQVPPSSGQYAKINTAYADGLANGYGGYPAGAAAGGFEAANKVTDVLGMPVNYWLTIDFSGFRKLVDSLGGVDINVPTGFTANYPANDNPQINPNWKVIQFKAGEQHMNGEQAIEYARARYVIQPASEGSDFARSARQQLLIRAILDRVRQVGAWPGLLSATDALQGAMYTNLSLADLMLFSRKLDLSHAARIGLTDQNVLVDAQSSDGQDILLPASGGWNAIKQYVTTNLKG
jgi:polyisoprenyl-teichoic acid--peptidoglycan teichoic acid transferase